MFAIVDDDVARSRDVTQVVKGSQRATGAKVFSCRSSDAVDAVFEEALKEHVPQITFIVEREMVNVDSLGIISRIRNFPADEHDIDIIIMAIGHESSQAQEMFQAGINFFIRRYDISSYFRH